MSAANRVDPPPVETFEERLKLRRREAHHPVLDLRPTKLTFLQALGQQARLLVMAPLHNRSGGKIGLPDWEL